MQERILSATRVHAFLLTLKLNAVQHVPLQQVCNARFQQEIAKLCFVLLFAFLF